MALSKKKEQPIWIWICVDRDSYKPISFVVGERNQGSLRVLLDKIKNKNYFAAATDSFRPYLKLIPKNKHLEGKAHTYIVESINSLVRNYLARFTRRTKAYSKSVEMIVLSIALLFKYNNVLSMLT